MTNKDFIYQRRAIYVGKDIDPNSDRQVEEVLRNKFNIHLPQRTSMNESLAAVNSDHEILELIKKYRVLTAE
jgi:DNA polymerase I-like protein with 3'-5' exonuclease and polymerase domains